jgi:hypothetical protein
VREEKERTQRRKERKRKEFYCRIKSMIQMMEIIRVGQERVWKIVKAGNLGARVDCA